MGTIALCQEDPFWRSNLARSVSSPNHPLRVFSHLSAAIISPDKGSDEAPRETMTEVGDRWM